MLCVAYLASAKYKRNAALILEGGLLDRKGSNNIMKKNSVPFLPTDP